MQLTDISQFDYNLPKELIAQAPLINRCASRLMLLDRNNSRVEHTSFFKVGEYLNKGDLLVLNNSRVRHARLLGFKNDTYAKIELLLLKRLNMHSWEGLIKPSKRVREGTLLTLGNGKIEARVTQKSSTPGLWEVTLSSSDDIEDVIYNEGAVPLPPYILNNIEDPNRYQTVYADKVGSAATPTAGLHFTDKLLKELQDQGIETTFLTLHVGLGTFRPVSTRYIEEHKMHSEYYELDDKTARKIKETKLRGNRVIAVGTTATRVLESIASDNQGSIIPASGWTDIFIYPGYSFLIVDGMITNFHLPKSTLLMLVSAFSSKELIAHAYEEAIKERYRFFSFGDAMLIL